ncbi:MAG TPA: SIR2 family protein, partial [Nannocystis sp.]
MPGIESCCPATISPGDRPGQLSDLVRERENMNTHTFTDELKHTIAVRPQEVVVVVGAGVTIGALRGSPLAEQASWHGLLLGGLERLRATGASPAADVDRIRGLLDSDDVNLWIDAAQMITRGLGGPRGGEQRAWLRASVGAFAGAVHDRDVLTSLRALSERGVLLATVNYDGVLEAATGLPAVTWRDAARVQRVLRGDERGILHLHGYWEEPESLVFGARSYDEVVADEHARTVLKSLGMQRTFLFVGHGTGLQDPNWGSFLRWAEAVLAGMEHRHYRLVRDEERVRVQAEHPQGQRVVALPYGATHGALAPFLRSLLPAAPNAAPPGAAAPVATSPRPVRTIVLRINIGDPNDRGFHPVSEQEARDLVDVPDPTFHALEAQVEPRRLTARNWRGLAQDVDDLLTRMRGGIGVKEAVRIVIVGQAPLPVFAYLGYQMRRERGQIELINYRQRGDAWDHIGAPGVAVDGDDGPFQVDEPELGRERRGKVVLSILCSNEYPYNPSMVEPMITAEGAALLCSYRIQHKRKHDDAPMDHADLTVLVGLVNRALVWIKDRCPDSDGLVVAMGGPTWAAFWVARALNANVRGRIDFPYFTPGRGYERALAARMHEAPWFTGRAKLMIMAAEPDDQGSVRAGRAADAIQQALER